MNPFDYDLHTHTQFSDGRSPVADMLHAACANGLKGFVLTDHVFSPEQADQLLAQYAQIDRKEYPLPVLFGCETAVQDVNGHPCARPDQLRKFELVLMDCNGILFSELAREQLSRENLRDRLCEIMIRACENAEVDILAHPFNFGNPPLEIPLELFDNIRVGKIAEAFRKHNKIFEIMNQMYFWHSKIPFEHFHREYMRILTVFKNAGVHFSIGSDTHSCCGIGCFRWCERVVGELGIGQELFIPETFQERILK